MERKEKAPAQRVLELLAEGNKSSREISDELGMPYATARTYVSFLVQLGLAEPVPKERRGKPFRLTEQGRRHLDSLRKGKGE